MKHCEQRLQQPVQYVG